LINLQFEEKTEIYYKVKWSYNRIDSKMGIVL
jgi:hypothetical protein